MLCISRDGICGRRFQSEVDQQEPRFAGSMVGLVTGAEPGVRRRDSQACAGKFARVFEGFDASTTSIFSRVAGVALALVRTSS